MLVLTADHPQKISVPRPHFHGSENKESHSASWDLGFILQAIQGQVTPGQRELRGKSK